MTDLATLIPLPSASRVADDPHVVDSAEESLDVVVCCASDRVELALATFPGLVAERLLPRVVVGIDADSGPLADAMIRASSPTLFVLCVGGSVGGARTRDLVETFAARRDPLHRLLVLEVDHEHADALRSSIVRGAAGMRRRMGSRGSGLGSMRHSGRATALGGVVAPADLATGEPAVPRPSVVVSTGLRDEVGPIPEHVRPAAGARERPVLRLVPAPSEDEAPVDPSAVTAELPIAAVDAVLRTAPPVVPRTGKSLVTAVFMAGSIASVLAFTPDSGAPTHLTAGLSRIGSLEPSAPVVSPPADPIPDIVYPPEPSTVAPVPEKSPLQKAVAAGRIRELDLLLVTPRYATPSTWRVAATRCKARAVNGVRGWRLPRIDELRKLGRHHMLLPGSYWSSGRVTSATVPSNHVFESTGQRVEALAKDERAETICVRPRSHVTDER